MTYICLQSKLWSLMLHKPVLPLSQVSVRQRDRIFTAEKQHCSTVPGTNNHCATGRSGSLLLFFTSLLKNCDSRSSYDFYTTRKVVTALPLCSFHTLILWEGQEGFWTLVILRDRLQDGVKLKIIHFALEQTVSYLVIYHHASVKQKNKATVGSSSTTTNRLFQIEI